MEDELEKYSKYFSRVKDGLMYRIEASEEQAQTIINSHTSSLQQANCTVHQLKTDLESVRKSYDAEHRRLNEKVSYQMRIHYLNNLASSSTSRTRDKNECHYCGLRTNQESARRFICRGYWSKNKSKGENISLFIFYGSQYNYNGSKRLAGYVQLRSQTWDTKVVAE